MFNDVDHGGGVDDGVDEGVYDDDNYANWIWFNDYDDADDDFDDKTAHKLISYIQYNGQKRAHRPKMGNWLWEITANYLS